MVGGLTCILCGVGPPLRDPTDSRRRHSLNVEKYHVLQKSIVSQIVSHEFLKYVFIIQYIVSHSFPFTVGGS